ncbi:hypothetical protein EHI8A_081960 [Entamoeba histolytica HM-1:IMSS-B]|uniref:Uncharacterized protein n=6 Tax=Entamoeba histolytica TaxID=5759 RepID=C4M9M0_ENTH1|nr:hypothetical protein EHI_112810 [Entamoeba histolytica HM-1:IMSS]EMD48170.1 Hypothetical protein EHI5A_121490 [Entamoeba histolytica KU27]EMH75623.1 hypothetical protein EHI8A_081960 [Entamoeba histolytica HM-1:IMSS-B]EMS12916.1 hypothetical protein KM1_142490 [Entamoeba histolytica HM-3:IMSS]ENY61130.1 hypothetical protein EHI7A_079730 [Entamoeba histolytica HM-1:IMSS-A]GAT98379.1 hypothetical protein CL6EHI_112810 [Entamoeba histolytica]|eukprot:XP_656106.1 hypothetical protein EHI_112810 [Entamoeba histolytica HM-1:IMSS]
MWCYIKSLFGFHQQQQDNCLLSSMYGQSYITVPSELATTLTFSQLTLQPSQQKIKKEKITLDKVYNEAKPQNPTISQQIRRVGKIFAVLSEDRKKDILDLISPSSTVIISNPRLRMKMIEKRINQMNKRIKQLEEIQKGKDVETQKIKL